MNRLGRSRMLLAGTAVLLILIAWQQVWDARRGLLVRVMTHDGVPMQYMAPANARAAPAILIAHGFGGSKQLMLGYGHVLAHAGYAVLLWDFDGHGANPAPLNRDGEALLANLAAARAGLIAQPEVDATQIGLLGHSMGSGVVMQAGIQDGAEYRATVAISPTSAEVTPELPGNLMLQAGEREPRFVANAKRLLAQAGGENEDIVGSRARRFVLVPGVEHITILFSAQSHQEAREWLDQVFGVQRATGYQDRRIFWYVLHLASWLGLAMVVAPLFKSQALSAAQRRRPWHWLGLLIAPFAASGVIALINAVVDMGTLAGLAIGGGLALWFLVMGLFWLLSGFRPTWPDGRSLAWGAILFVVLWVAFGALAHFVWLPWLLIPTRLARWPFLALACLPWLLATGMAQSGASLKQRAGWWLAQCVLVLGGLFLLIYLAPSLAVLILVLPLLPLVLGIIALVGAIVDRPWSYAVGNALFFAWLLLAYFPLAG